MKIFPSFSGHSSYGLHVCLKARQPLFLFTLIWVICSASPGCLDNRPSRLIDILMESPKLISPQELLSGFSDGKTRSRVIVNLRNPLGDKRVINFKNIKQRQKLQQDVKIVQDRVINNLDPKGISAINRFTYIFGFSAEVTLQCLQKLIENKDVITVEKDRILHQH
jgi:hypothetical protein